MLATTSQKCALGCMLLLTALWLTMKLDHAGYTHRFPKVRHRTTPSSLQAPAFPCKPLSKKERLDAFGDLQGYTRSIYTSSPEAQKAFDTGMMLAYGFNQPEALRSFHQAMEDPTAPAPYWGKAYALGPFLNKIAGPTEGSYAYPVFSPQELEDGKKAVEQGLRIAEEQMAKHASAAISDTQERLRKLLERDKAYLQGISHVFFSGSTYGPSFVAGTKAYAQALEEWAEAHPEDTDALALAAEALANLQPWDFWDAADPPQPKAGTPKILSLLRAALDRNPAHPLALHVMIHVTEAAAPGPSGAGQATFAAERMRSAASMIGHLQHMPSHTYLNTGYWHKGVEVNEASLQVDIALATRCVEPYTPYHNAQMLIYSAMSGAEKEAAERWASRLAGFAKVFGPSYETDGKDHVMLPFVWLRFASWRPLLALKPGDLDPSGNGVRVSDQAKPFSEAVYHLVRSYAFAAMAASFPDEDPGMAGLKQRSTIVQRAYDELHALEVAADGLKDDAVTQPGQGLGLFSLAYKAISMHGLLMARARLSVLEGNFDAAVAHLNAARHIEVSTGYMEPPRFFQFSIECLGWVFLRAGRLSEAAQAYKQGLQQFPRSPWPLIGFKQVWETAARLQKAVQLEQPPHSDPLTAQGPQEQGATSLLTTLHASSSSNSQQLQPLQQQQLQTAVSDDKKGQDVTSRELIQISAKELKNEQGENTRSELKIWGRKLLRASNSGEREGVGLGDNDQTFPSAGLNVSEPNAAEPNAMVSSREGHGTVLKSMQQGKGEDWTEHEAQGGPSSASQALPPGMPTAEEVDALLSELSAESGGLTQLPSSCPSFSEPLQP